MCMNRFHGGFSKRILTCFTFSVNPLEAILNNQMMKIQQDGMTIFLTTHYIEEAEFLADRVAFIDQGKIVALDTPQSLMRGIGRWAMDTLKADTMQTYYFKSQQEAKEFAAGHKNGFAVRRVNLEDAFLKMTGKKVK